MCLFVCFCGYAFVFVVLGLYTLCVVDCCIVICFLFASFVDGLSFCRVDGLCAMLFLFVGLDSVCACFFVCGVACSCVLVLVAWCVVSCGLV